MESIKNLLIPITAITLGLSVAASDSAGAENAAKKPVVSQIASAAANSSTEQQRNDAQKEGEKTIDKDASAAIEEAQSAVKAISDGKSDQALAALERATGKIDILTARKPSAALIPVSVEVQLIDPAPKDLKAVRDMTAAAQTALSDHDYPVARTLIDQLASEIHVKTYNLPLATYPLAMQTAARYLEEEKTEEAKQVLRSALNTLIVTDRVLPMPMVAAQAAVKDAQAKSEKDKPAARKILAAAKDELELAKALGYANHAPEYASLEKSISELDNKLTGTESTTSGFDKLRESMSAFFERINPEPPASSAKQAQN